jgi:membrane protease YdiL (CAAX protease family)
MQWGDPPWPAPVPVPIWPTPLLPPRVWLAILVPVLAIVAAAMAAGVVLVAAAVLERGPGGLRDQDALIQWIGAFAATPLGFTVVVLPGQLTFLAVAIGAAALSPEPLVTRLRMNRPSVPWWAVLLLLPTTLFAGAVGDLLMTLLFGDDALSDNLKMLDDVFRNAAGGFLVLVTAMISLLPGFSEEMLFRGYCQGRLLRRWHPAAAVATSGVLFAAAHMDPVHVVGVLPLGIWLGVIAWLTGSIWPSVICHAANNAFAVLITASGVTVAGEHIEFDAVGITMLGVTGAITLLSLWVMVKYRRRTDTTATTTTAFAGFAPAP